jgi:hypothetical protein
MTNSIDRDQWLNVTSESRVFFFSALGHRTHDPCVPEPKRTPLGYILLPLFHKINNLFMVNVLWILDKQ